MRRLAFAERAFKAFAAVLVATATQLLAPAVLADDLLCEEFFGGKPIRYLIRIDDRRNTVEVINADTDEPYSVTIGELNSERVLFAFLNMQWDAQKFVRNGKVVRISLTMNTAVRVDRATNTFTKIGYVTDDKGETLSVEDLNALQAEEVALAAKKKGGPNHHPMFWVVFEAAIYRSDGLCRSAPPPPDQSPGNDDDARGVSG